VPGSSPLVDRKWTRAGHALPGAQGLPVRLLFLGPSLCLDEAIEVCFESCESLRECPIAFIVDDSGTRARCEIQVGHIDQALQITRVPRRTMSAETGIPNFWWRWPLPVASKAVMTPDTPSDESL